MIGARARLAAGARHRRASGENFLASDAMALAGVTDQIVYLEEGDVVDLQLGKHWISGAARRRPLPHRAARGAHRARAHRRRRARARTATTCRRRSSSSRAPSPTRWTRVNGIIARAVRRRRATASSRTSTGADPRLRHQLLRRLASRSYWLESIAKIPTSVEVASEYRYRDSVPNPRTLVVTITPERRDRRHARRAEARARARHGAHADDLQRRDQRDGARVRARLTSRAPASRSASRRPRPSRRSSSACSC